MGFCTQLLCADAPDVSTCSIRGNGEVIKREEFDQRKAAAEAARLARLQRKPQKLASQGKDTDGCPLLQVLQLLHQLLGHSLSVDARVCRSTDLPGLSLATVAASSPTPAQSGSN